MSRDTDLDWALIADREPFFGVLANSEYLSENLDDAAEERFFASGRADIAHVVSTIRQHLDADFSPRVAVDFGCGVGRLSLAMSAHAESVVGVDIAPSMRRIAAERAAARGVTNVRFADVPPESGLDWVNSLIVLQHIPPERGMALLASLAGSVVDGGVISIQVTTHRDARHMHELLRDVELARYDGSTMKVYATAPSGEMGQMSMYDYDLGQLYALFVSLRFANLWIEHTDHAGVHGAWIFGRRAAAV